MPQVTSHNFFIERETIAKSTLVDGHRNTIRQAMPTDSQDFIGER